MLLEKLLCRQIATWCSILNAATLGIAIAKGNILLALAVYSLILFCLWLVWENRGEE
jgi:hypothetical protein